MTKDPGARLTEIADDLRAIATNGLCWAANEYDKARYEKILSLAAELLSMADTRDADEIERAFRGDLSVRTPFVGVEAAIFNDAGRLLLVQRADNAKWCIPGGAADVGESPSGVAVREAWEETGLQVQAVRLIGVYDSRLTKKLPGPVHLYHLLFLCRKTGGDLALSNETIAYNYFTQAQALVLPLHGGHAYRIPDAFKAWRGEIEGCVFH